MLHVPSRMSQTTILKATTRNIQWLMGDSISVASGISSGAHRSLRHGLSARRRRQSHSGLHGALAGFPVGCGLSEIRRLLFACAYAYAYAYAYLT